ncbi:hypothetical protein ADIAL_0185 [Alkalibacterium sp. AK22]|uniref:hypothetical protein n=1 Tax=Alkalibacterium sp. AK22 TaxID=1229520 RepID=UPI00044D33D9|nr:hypothetical protein [Alkalibacterium sp. AK22]EXJ24446.1 hypothetical protein ADIAL_0185 [Alkalibacterium sp. AK22]
MPIIIVLLLTGFMMFLSFKYMTRSLNMGSRIFSRGFSSLGSEEDQRVTCPNCGRQVRRTDNPYCSRCNTSF